MYSQWVQSYRDLPILVNQWCNVMRWEMRTRLFLRTAEFLWQEGHTAHETEQEAQDETLKMLDVYADFAENVLALPVIKGAKTDSEKFPGAVTTYCIEALMQDGKALQAGTSHNLGQNFAKAFDIKFLGRDQKQQHAYTTSWGVSTRLIGATIMAHSDDEGLILPPHVAPNVVAIVPIFRGEVEMAKVKEYVRKVLVALVGEDEVKAADARAKRNDIETYFFDKLTHQSIVVDWRDARPGDKQYHWEQRGVPFRIEVGPRDVDGNAMVLKKRLDRSKEIVNLADVSATWMRGKLEAVQKEMFQKALAYRESHTKSAGSYEEMKAILEKDGGFVRCFFKPDRANEAKIKDETKATVRCIPFAQNGEKGKCIYSGEETTTQVLFAVAY
jgi:prolyl-tRNA synthetase